MRNLLRVAFCAGMALPVFAEEAKPAAAAPAKPAVAPAKPAEGVVQAPKGGLDWDAGADLRVRQEVLGNMPRDINTPNAPGRTPTSDKNTQNYIRFRPRAWAQVKNENFKLYTRIADEFRYYSSPNLINSRWPDELFVDNLYLDLYGLLDDHLDLRIGRQDFYGATGPTYGAGRVFLDGTPGDGSRTVYMDAIKATVKFDEKNALDVLAIYNSPYNYLNVGHSQPFHPAERPLNFISPNGQDLAEWGGGLYFKSKEVAEVPFELYYFFKRETKARDARNRLLDGRKFHTVGTRLTPKLSETWSAEFEVAGQAGEKDSGPSTSGYMGYSGLTYAPLVATTAKPYFTGSIYYLSGDDERGNGHNDTAWDPVWARWPQFSELYVYNSLYGAGYWSNIIYPSLSSGVNFGPGHKVASSVGPIFSAVEDDVGGGSGSNLEGWLGTVRYDFPLAKKIFGKRGELFGHVMAEVLDPGDYYQSDKVAYFLRWEVNARF